MPQEAPKASVIEIIQGMVANGESEEKIVQTLKDLGVSPDQAKRLLLVGQADTFSLLRGEINKIVATEVERKKPELISFMEKEADQIGAKTHEKISEQVLADVKKYEKDITGQSKTFQEQMQENVRRVTELSDRTKNALNELGELVSQTRLDMDEMKVKGVGARNRILSIFLLGLGAIFLVVDLLLITTRFLPAGNFITPDAMIIAVILTAAGLVLMFVGSNL